MLIESFGGIFRGFKESAIKIQDTFTNVLDNVGIFKEMKTANNDLDADLSFSYLIRSE